MQQATQLFANRQAFRTWLVEHHRVSSGTWLVFGKVAQIKTLTAQEALEEALCFGWIDGRMKSVNTQKYLKRFTPRRKGSVWSERNRKLAEQLIAAGIMTEAGHEAIAQAKRGGTWERPRPAPIVETQIAVLAAALAGHAKALANFQNMSHSVRKTYTAAYLDAKQEATRKRRLEKIIARLNDNKPPM
jgi:uncharacterized protein YdeI (YjbR/CyaY-like superfamily)